MSETTNIEWAEHTGGPWLGCTVVSPGCGHCYAKALAESRLGPIFRKSYKAAGIWDTAPVWGDKAVRVLSKGFWNDARRINAQHAKAGTRGRWFPSMIDWLDTMPAGIIDQDGKQLEPVAVLADFLKLIHDTPNLDWLLLTKRLENFGPRLRDITCHTGLNFPLELKMFVHAWVEQGNAPSHVWVGTSVEDQQRADERIPELLKIPARIRFLSVEPLLGPVELRNYLSLQSYFGHSTGSVGPSGIDWVIVGGESGPGARPCNVEWIRSVVRQCKAAGVNCFVKQLGSKPVITDWAQWPMDNYHLSRRPDETEETVRLKHPKGGDPEEWTEDLRVRDFPSVEVSA